MKEDDINNSTARFPFKRVKSQNGICYRQEIRNHKSKEGQSLDIEHNGHDHLSLVFRELYETNGGKQGKKTILRWVIDTKATVQMASLLFLFAENYMRDSDEVPYTMIVDKERASFGQNWINEDYATAILRTERRKSRSYLFGVMKRCIETCNNDDFIQYLATNLAMWAAESGDRFTQDQAEKSLFQLGMVSKEDIN